MYLISLPSFFIPNSSKLMEIDNSWESDHLAQDPLDSKDHCSSSRFYSDSPFYLGTARYVCAPLNSRNTVSWSFHCTQVTSKYVECLSPHCTLWFLPPALTLLQGMEAGGKKENAQWQTKHSTYSEVCWTYKKILHVVFHEHRAAGLYRLWDR